MLARMRSTGTPLDLAFRFNISERSVKRIVKEIKNEGIKIRYCHIAVSYVIDDNGEKVEKDEKT
jgi:DNA-binding Lrp family transcriptional regulator